MKQRGVRVFGELKWEESSAKPQAIWVGNDIGEQCMGKVKTSPSVTGASCPGSIYVLENVIVLYHHLREWWASNNNLFNCFFLVFSQSKWANTLKCKLNLTNIIIQNNIKILWIVFSDNSENTSLHETQCMNPRSKSIINDWRNTQTNW